MRKGFPHGETLTIRRLSVERDANGDAVRDDYGEVQWQEVDVKVSGCAVYPAGSMGQAFAFENVGGAPSLQSFRLVVYMPPHTRVDANDKLEYRGLWYEAEGDPGYSHSPFSGTEGPITLYLKRVTG